MNPVITWMILAILKYTRVTATLIATMYARSYGWDDLSYKHIEIELTEANLLYNDIVKQMQGGK